MNTILDSLLSIAFTAVFFLTLAFFGIFLGGCWSLAVGTGTGIQIFSLLFVGGLFTLGGSVGLGKIWDTLLNQ